MYNEEEMVQFWILRVCPLQVKIAVADGKRNAGSQEQAFMNKLENDKKDFEVELMNLKRDFENLKTLHDYKKIYDYSNIATDINTRLEISVNKVEGFNQREILFNIPPSCYDDLDGLIAAFDPYKKMWSIGYNFQQDKEQWFTGPLIRVRYTEVHKKVDQYRKDIGQLKRKFDNDEGDTDAAKEVCKAIQDDIKAFDKKTPLLQYLTKEAIIKSKNYWNIIFQEIGIPKIAQNTATLEVLSGSGMLDHLETIERLSVKAEKEYNLELKLNTQILEKLKNAKADIVPNSKIAGTFLIQGVDELQQLFDEQFNVLIMMKQNPNVGPIKRRVEEQERKLIGFQD